MFYEVIPHANLKHFCLDVFAGYGFAAQECEIITDVLLAADLSGFESHGVQRLVRYHREILSGMTEVGTQPEVVFETPLSAVWDAHKGMGQVVGVRAMQAAIQKAKTSGIGMVAVRNSNHYGIAGYYPNMAVKEDLMGICMTNSESIAVPTHGKSAMMGTNPIALGFPADPRPFLYDAATTVVPRGKLEVYNKNAKPLPDGWALDADGKNCCNAHEIIENIIHKTGGGIAPLGGASELLGGHKGFGLGIMVELFSGILSSGATSNYVSCTPEHSKISSFFAAMDYGLFGEKTAIRQHFSSFLQELRDSPKAEGEARIYIHGEKEFESRENKLRDGIPVNQKTKQEMREIAAHLGLDYNRYGLEAQS